MNRLARNRCTLGAAGTAARNGRPMGEIDGALGLEHGLPDPLLDTGKAIPSGIGKGSAPPAQGGAHVRYDIPKALAGHRLELQSRSVDRARATRVIGQHTPATHAMGGREHEKWAGATRKSLTQRSEKRGICLGHWGTCGLTRKVANTVLEGTAGT